MSLETGTFISDLVITNPTSSDPKNQGDDHLRLLKSTVKATFPNVAGAVTPSHIEFNYVAGVTSLIQTQINAKAPLASPALTGTATLVNQETSGTATFAGVTINGTLDMNAGTSSTVTGLATPVGTTDAATKGYVDTQIAGVLASAPGVLDTLDELAAALGDDANFAVNTASSIAAKLPLAGGTMSGVLNMGSQRITALATPSAGTDAVTLDYVSTLYGSTAAASVSAAAAAADRVQTGLDRVQTGLDRTSTTSSAGTATTKASEANASAIAAAASAASIAGGPVASVNGRTGVVTGVQDTLVSNTNIKTVNSTSLLGSGDIVTGDVVSGGALGTPASGNLSNTTADGTNAVGFRHIPQISQSAAYTLVLTDASKHILHPSADTTARIFTIPANASVAFPIGTAITFVNQASAGVMTIAITTDTMRLAGAGTTGSRTLAANGVATAIKLTATEWIISGGSSLT